MKNLSILSNQMIVVLTLCGLTLGFQSCTEKAETKIEPVAEAEFDLAEAKAEIEEANKNFMALVAAGDSVGIANLYTTDAKLMFAGKPADVGRTNIQTAFSQILNSGVTKVDLKTKEVFGTEDLLAEEGEVIVYVGDMVVAEEKFIVLWKKEDGKWKLFRDISNSNTPPQ
ncbi:DUF4440 domain-containing protein [Algoriphagus sp. D3-2-R+10]|uniref:YybH family protein n=1 Tax=Algoriphagus aurantiacus TaxID=3103948 RepID=UPI002B3BBF89|nr:hypothetical protein [Algoriphagus sp. D3-2-R+10]MEB2774200.1 DUF4440 domain-containing protein [Algoriphagus sp. D3-2-R+10]